MLAKVNLHSLYVSGPHSSLTAVTSPSMGRTNPTYRDRVNEFENDWQQFRGFLRRRHQPHFDRLIGQARNHADAGGVQNPVEPKWAILVLIGLAQEEAIAELKERVSALEEYAIRPTTWCGIIFFFLNQFIDGTTSN